MRKSKGMILRIRNSRTFRVVCVTLALNIFFQLVAPVQSFALTGGPAQPEFSSFTPVGTSDMVDLSSGDMSYNIPLIDVGGYPLNLAYNGGVGMDQEASMVGLGWNLSVGQINRNVRGLPDDFKGDLLTYENYLKPNITAGASFQFETGITGVENENGEMVDVLKLSETSDPNFSAGISVMYNNYTGYTVKHSGGIQKDLGENVSVGFNAQSGPDGLTVSPSLSIHQKSKDKEIRDREMGMNLGVSMNSRQGLSAMTLGMSHKTQKIAIKNNKGTRYADRKVALGSSISFTDPVYTPTKRVGMETGSFTLNAELGMELFGAEGAGEITAYGTVMQVKASELKKSVKGYGYANTDQADKYSVLDFNREKDGSFTVNSTNLPITNYTYDIYSVQGQGVSGMYRPFRNQVGYVYDAHVEDGSFSGQLGLEFGTGNASKFGVDIEGTDVVSHSGVWEDQNHLLPHLQASNQYEPGYEAVHYKNVGDLSADQDFGMFNQTGDYQPIQVPFTAPPHGNGPWGTGMPFFRKAKSEFLKKTSSFTTSSLAVGGKIKRTQRQKRNQAINNLTVQNVQDGIGYGPLAYDEGTYSLPSGAKAHHTAEVQIVRNDGARYVYGLPAYNTLKKEATFAVNGPTDCSSGLVGYNPTDLDARITLPNDQYLNRVTTPAYVHTHLLTSVLSTDYVDIKNDGPTVDDLGSYTKFSYVRKSNNYKWRVPYLKNKANYNEGLKTNHKDDQGNYVYGEKELYYIDKIETKTHIAVFKYSERKDGIGVQGEGGGMASASDPNAKMYKLESISLYSQGEYDEQNPTSSTPIKVVHFEYSYSLCPDVDNNNGDAPEGPSEISNHGGKLTLKKVYFTYRNSHMGKYTGYKFNYGEYKPVSNGQGGYYHPDEYSGVPLSSGDLNTVYGVAGVPIEMTGLNPKYNIKGYDSWGNYMPNTPSNCGNLDALTAAEFPFVEQDKDIQDVRSSVWSMRKISLPSGGDINIEYESDDYGFVQDKEVMKMFKVVGAGEQDNASGTDDVLNQTPNTPVIASLFRTDFSDTPNRFLYVKVEDDDQMGSGADYQKYLKGIWDGPPIYFRFLVNTTQMGGTPGLNGEDPAHFDYITGYLSREETAGGKIFDYPAGSGVKYMSIPVEYVDKEGGVVSSTEKVHPISKAAWHFCRKYLTNYSYSNQPNGDTEDIKQIVADLLSPNILNNLIEVFNGPNSTLENKNVGRRFITGKSWLRLNTSNGEKLGGGCRVKSIRMSDVWDEMTSNSGYQTMNYGQQYTYTLDGTEDGKTSGVATYEPVGNKENPFVQPVYSTTEHLLAPDEQNFIEKPFGESFFPSPQVTYSRVTVTNLQAGQAPAGKVLKRLHKTGKVVTDFYTSKDFPTVVDQTRMQVEEDKTPLLLNMLNLNIQKHLTASQGYVIHLNDMNGKQKSQRVFAEGQSSPISGVDYIYSTQSTGGNFSAANGPSENKGRLNNNVRVINPDGSVNYRTIGVEVDVVNDFRENKTKTRIAGVNTNAANFVFGIVPLIVPMPIPDVTNSKDQFRSVSTTKVINTFGLLKETIAYDAGAAVYTRNLAWDASTGEVLVTETVDEFNDKYYTMNFPAHWYYDGMGQAAQNLGLNGILSASGSGYTIQGMLQPGKFFVEGDELYIPNYSNKMAWVSKVAGNKIYLIDEFGDPVTGNLGGAIASFKIVRSGRRNLQSAGIMNVTLMHNPLTDALGNAVSNLGETFLEATAWDDWHIINAGAVDYAQDWTPPCECNFTADGSYQYTSESQLQITIDNPYRTNKKGVWRTKSSRTYLTGRNRHAAVTPRQQGFFNTFSPMYKLSANGNWIKDFEGWTFVAEVEQYSPYGFELENRDALNRYSGAQYGYNNMFPMAVGANTRYQELGFDGFEDYVGFDGCPNAHFTFKHVPGVHGNLGNALSTDRSHTGKYSLRVGASSSATLSKKLDCVTNP